MEQCEQVNAEVLSDNLGKAGNIRSAIIAVVAHAMIPIAFIAFFVCLIPVFADRSQQSNVVPLGNVLLLFNISSVLIEHIYVCLGLLYILLTLDAVVCLILFKMEKRIWASLWSWFVIICQSSAMFFCVFVLYDFLKTLTA